MMMFRKPSDAAPWCNHSATKPVISIHACDNSVVVVVSSSSSSSSRNSQKLLKRARAHVSTAWTTHVSTAHISTALLS